MNLKRRSSENNNPFENTLMEKLNLYEMQGLLVNAEWNPTIGMEAIQSDDIDSILAKIKDSNYKQHFLEKIFEKVHLNKKRLIGRYILTQNLDIPLFIILYGQSKNNQYIFANFKICLSDNNDNRLNLSICHEKTRNEEDFINWWKEHKGTIQTKDTANGAKPRIQRTLIDKILEKHGLEWGGNIDAFHPINSNKHNITTYKVQYIVDFISVSKDMEENADPHKWYNDGNPKHGPRYEGLKAQSIIANKLNVPHIMLYIDKNPNPNVKRLGITSIKQISQKKIELTHDPNTDQQIIPGKNIVYGLDNIEKEINNIISISNPPTVI